MLDLAAVQAALAEFGFDAWLLYDFRNSNPLARRVLEIGQEQVATRRFFYMIPATGEPQKLVHRIESGVLDHLPGGKRVYLRWQELETGVAELIAGAKTVAMEFSPRNANPYVSRVDAGTFQLVESLGAEVVSSGDLIQQFEATWDEDQWRMHQEAAGGTNAAFEAAFGHIARRIGAGETTSEVEVQQVILEHFAANSLITDHPPIVAVGPHSGDPHYAPSSKSDSLIGADDFVLIDLWAKLDQPRSVYSDLTRVGFVGLEVPDVYEEIFQIVARARDAAIDCVSAAQAAGGRLCGWEVDQAARGVITEAGYAEAFEITPRAA